MQIQHIEFIQELIPFEATPGLEGSQSLMLRSPDGKWSFRVPTDGTLKGLRPGHRLMLGATFAVMHVEEVPDPLPGLAGLPKGIN